MTAAVALRTLLRVLNGLPRVAVAVSGGVDSMTLATLAHRRKHASAAMFHAVSPAVPVEATERVQAAAQEQGWNLQLMDAGEFSDARYLENPVNRCFFCKSNLYGAIANRTDAPIVSGTNLDDMNDFRPGLQAAESHAVRHPYVEARIDKKAIRAIAHRLGLPEIAELPASPCLSSRIETGIAVDPALLRLVHEVERLVMRSLGPQTVRCRVRSTAVVIELDHDSLRRAEGARFSAIRDQILPLVRRDAPGRDVRFEAYRTGSAFLRATQS